MKLMILLLCLLLSGCGSFPNLKIIRVSLVTVQMQVGGTSTHPEIAVDNDLAPNSTQIHSLPMDGSGTSNPVQVTP